MIDFDYSEGELIAYVKGEIDHHFAKKIRSELDMLMVQLVPGALILDLSGVSFMDSSGLGLVLGRYTKARAAGIDFSVIGCDRRIIRMFEMAGLERIVKIERKI